MFGYKNHKLQNRKLLTQNKNIMDYNGTKQDIMEYTRKVWNKIGNPGTYWEIMKRNEKLWNI